MEFFDRIRHRLRTLRGRPFQHDEFTTFLRLVDRHQVGGLVMSHFRTNPEEYPDHVVFREGLCWGCVRRSGRPPRWLMRDIEPGELSLLERSPESFPQEHLVLFTDVSGDVLLQVYCPEERARQVLATARRVPSEIETERRA